ncbi:hypothetical protein PSTT_04529 [Puccinia striiformis]|uniref:Uncharacterized protein n=1 Tax=Puccinia striiformis TaxID=27350 RepID=A0A2S4VSC7_9BASI|nr:hypothetical protein PSTT_04529 [Puccinia striiformis]
MVKSAKEMVNSVRKKSEQAYQDIARKVVSRLYQRVNEHGIGARLVCVHRFDGMTQYENETLDHLGRIIFPKLKKNLNLLSIAMDPSSFQGDIKLGRINSVMDTLSDIDIILGELDDWISIKHNQNISDQNQSQGAPRGAFSDVLGACGTLLNDSCFLSASIEQSSVGLKWNNLVRHTKSTNEKIDGLTKWFENSMLNVAKEEWQQSVKQIETWLEYLLELSNPGSQRIYGEYEMESDDEEVKLRAIDLKFLEAGIVVFKLCRLYFDKLSRSTDYYPLIFDEPSTRMDVNQFKLLLQVIRDTRDCTADLISAMPVTYVDRISEDQESDYMLIEMIGGFIRISRILWEYYDSLVIRNYPRVYPEVMAEARQWLDSWNSLLLISVANFMGFPVCKWSWRELAAGLDLSEDEFVDGGGWRDRWQLANNGELDQKSDGEPDN